MIDAAWSGSANRFGDTADSDYTTVDWETGAGKGLTVTPAKGDTSKTMFLPNAGVRYAGGNRVEYGATGRFFSTTNYNVTNAWYLVFRADSYSFGGIYSGTPTKLDAFPLRCVRS